MSKATNNAVTWDHVIFANKNDEGWELAKTSIADIITEELQKKRDGRTYEGVNALEIVWRVRVELQEMGMFCPTLIR